MPRRNGLSRISILISILVAAAVLWAGESSAGWKNVSRSLFGAEPRVVAESCKRNGDCLEVYAFEGEVWARLGLGQDRGIDPSGPPTAIVDRKSPLEPELYFVDGADLRFQIWDGRGRMPEQMLHWIKGRKVNIRFNSTGGGIKETEFSLRGSSKPINKVVKTIYQDRGKR